MSATVIQGDDITFKILVKKDNGCYDLTNVTALTLKVPLAAGGEETFSLIANANLSILTTPTPVNGEVVVKIQDADTLLLEPAKNNIELQLDESGLKTTLQFSEGLEVIERYY